MGHIGLTPQSVHQLGGFQVQGGNAIDRGRLLAEARECEHAGGTLGLVPTMGALHAGHLSLVRRSRQEIAVTVVSIFVNPTPFDQTADLGRYPRQAGKDLALLRDAGVDAVFLPAPEDIFPDSYLYRVSESDLSLKLCGAHRPGHFDGMLAVVMKLLNIGRPTRSYFGEKGFQQLLLVRGMAQAMNQDRP